jgi:hypothetical protein
LGSKYIDRQFLAGSAMKSTSFPGFLRAKMHVFGDANNGIARASVHDSIAPISPSMAGS